MAVVLTGSRAGLACVVLALFVPLIISSGGNSGSQASTLVIRAMALGEVTLADWWRVVHRELRSGLAMGVLLGLLGFARVEIGQRLNGAYGPHHLAVAITIAGSVLGVVTFGAYGSAAALAVIVAAYLLSGGFREEVPLSREPGEAIVVMPLEINGAEDIGWARLGAMDLIAEQMRHRHAHRSRQVHPKFSSTAVSSRSGSKKSTGILDAYVSSPTPSSPVEAQDHRASRPSRPHLTHHPRFASSSPS